MFQVSEVSQGIYKLKPQHLRNLEVEQWPFYTEAQRQMLKRFDSLNMLSNQLFTYLWCYSGQNFFVWVSQDQKTHSHLRSIVLSVIATPT